MVRTATIRLDFQTLAVRGPDATIVIRLMMACNDLSLANQALAEWKSEQPRNRKSRQKGAGMYFVRTQFAHLHEGLKVIEQIRDSPALMALVERCDPQTQESFRKLQDFLLGGSRRPEFEALVGRLRHNLTFHYDESGKMIERALRALADRTQDKSSTITRGDTAHAWYFGIADRIVDTIVCHQVWGISEQAGNVAAEADKKVDKSHEIFLTFVDFAGEFIWRYCRD